MKNGPSEKDYEEEYRVLDDLCDKLNSSVFDKDKNQWAKSLQVVDAFISRSVINPRELVIVVELSNTRSSSSFFAELGSGLLDPNLLKVYPFAQSEVISAAMMLGIEPMHLVKLLDAAGIQHVVKDEPDLTDPYVLACVANKLFPNSHTARDATLNFGKNMTPDVRRFLLDILRIFPRGNLESDTWLRRSVECS